MSTHNQCFRAKIRKEMITPVHPSFTIQKWGVRGYSLHGLASVMNGFYIRVKHNPHHFSKEVASINKGTRGSHNQKLIEKGMIMKIQNILN